MAVLACLTIVLAPRRPLAVARRHMGCDTLQHRSSRLHRGGCCLPPATGVIRCAELCGWTGATCAMAATLAPRNIMSRKRRRGS